MPAPRMIITAGPPGSGKSAAFPVSSFGVDFFNADDRAAEYNGGAYHGITPEIRRTVNREFEQFILGHIEQRSSFAIETTLRSSVTFEQASLAKSKGFITEMRYVALANFEMNLARVKARADAGGHSASESLLRSIHSASLANLSRCVLEMDSLWVYDNSAIGGGPDLVMEARGGHVLFLTGTAPNWLLNAI